MITPPPGWDTPANVESSLWAMLRRGAADAKDPLHTPVFVTQGPYGPNPRTVILRKASDTTRTLVCFSDVRTEKVTDIQADPAVAWLFWHPRRKTQLRVYGHATVHTGGPETDAAWQGLTPGGRRNYAADPAPRTPVDTPEAGIAAYTPVTDTDIWRPHFVMIHTQVTRLDAVLLDESGHRRLLLDWSDPEPVYTWVVP
ncbi:MAG: pyridoxamine 5'-phosphate oxidase family protein [Bacteroidia bacterium]|nr:pyridoxamine 5'-phosphate oxidase family protein [Bacteroidia bacterium]